MYAYANGGAGSPTACPETSTTSDQCTLGQALSLATASTTVYLASPGTTPYVGNWSVSTTGTSSSEPVVIEPASGVDDPTLSGNGGSSTGCSTSSCSGAVIGVGDGVYLYISGITVEDAYDPSDYGGGVNNGSGGNVVVSGSTFTDNFAYAGGAISNGSNGGTGTLTVTDSTFSGNAADGGGAIANGVFGTGTATVIGSTFSGNTSAKLGAILNAYAGSGHPGSGTLTVTASTFTGSNDLSIYSGLGGATAAATVAGDVFGTSCAFQGGTWTDLGYNVGVDTSCFASTPATGDVDAGSSLNSELGPLAANGGPTQTVALLDGNPAIGDIPNPTTVGGVQLCPTVDQRGVASPSGGACDAGAVQLGQTITFTSTPPSPGLAGTTYTVAARATSGLGVSFSIGSSSTAGACSISGSTVSFTGTGTCVVDATQVGNNSTGTGNYPPAEASQSIIVQAQAQSISFTSQPPSPAVLGGSYTPTATGGASGNPVVFSIGSSSTAGACSISAGTVSFTAVGTCVVDANQAGDTDYSAAPQAQQSFTIVPAAQAITFTSTAPTGEVVGGPSYTPTATGGASGNPVTFSIDPSSTSGCTISGLTVSFPGPAGTCLIDANQAGNADYSAAPEAQQSLSVAPAVTSLSPTHGPVGSSVIITGAGFSGATAVSFGGIAATSFTVDPDNQVTATVPAGALSGPVSVTAGGLTGTSATSFTVDPTLGATTGLPVSPVGVGTQVGAEASLAAPSNTTVTSATWDWGDGTTSQGTVSESGGSASVSGTHTYAAAGVYTVTLTVTDSDGGRSSSTFSAGVVVYDPSAGFVTGGGWIDSPARALVSQPSLTGKATFGFVSQYHKGATTPSGNTDFHFQAGSFEFQSSAYQWMVVTGWCRAQVKGTGTVNGTGSYTFLLTAVDGAACASPGSDTFRIQITDNANGALVYDNGTDQPIAGGSIQIHS